MAVWRDSVVVRERERAQGSILSYECLSQFVVEKRPISHPNLLSILQMATTVYEREICFARCVFRISRGSILSTQSLLRVKLYFF